MHKVLQSAPTGIFPGRNPGLADVPIVPYSFVIPEGPVGEQVNLDAPDSGRGLGRGPDGKMVVMAERGEESSLQIQPRTFLQYSRLPPRRFFVRPSLTVAGKHMPQRGESWVEFQTEAIPFRAGIVFAAHSR